MQTLSSLIADYLEVGKYEKQLSPDTIKAYRIDLRQFLEFTGDVWPDKEVLSTLSTSIRPLLLAR